MDIDGKRIKVEFTSAFSSSSRTSSSSSSSNSLSLWENQVQVSQVSPSTVKISNIPSDASKEQIVKWCSQYGVLNSSTKPEFDRSNQFILVEFAESKSVAKFLDSRNQNSKLAGDSSSASAHTNTESHAQPMVSSAYLQAFYNNSLIQVAQSIEDRDRKLYNEIHKSWMSLYEQDVKYNQARVDLDALEWEMQVLDRHISILDQQQ
jgi:RNA recognition motif-containing protein